MSRPGRAARRFFAQLDGALIASALALAVIGAVMVYSATRSWVVGDPGYYLRRQAINLLAGLIGLVAAVAVDYRRLLRASGVLYGLGAALLVAVLVAGRRVAGTQGWLPLGPFAVQPSELAKVALVLVLAEYLGQRKPPESWRDLVVPIGLTAGMAGLVLAQPDLGTAVVFGVILLGMLYAAQTPARYLGWMAGAAVLAATAAVLVTYLGWFEVLKPHQIQRLTVFVDPGAYRQGAGWNVSQSVIAIGSGKLFGRGLFSGPQTQLAFVPARHTDFIFSVIGEELGFFGAAAVLGLFFVLIRRGLAIAAQARDRGGALLAAGVVVMVGFHVVFNVGMTLGMVPVMGIPLPLLSYGGSHGLATLTALGMVAGVGARRVPW
ncbi:rod shape-determining protein RodA [Carboxydochorda subterranea]|uniref:Rod shape-determining protein RodA n=1 Tax=Carboxydichorda subterranea TaxID=3109565 RepID=A0ABZ1C1Q5_9FIRM|nr:rod shape-determining protein RodA [Limnochorda sp. L945t]WRP18223.1 rod shape-determining protein RodA [Limnochorda sp. L945t]